MLRTYASNQETQKVHTVERVKELCEDVHGEKHVTVTLNPRQSHPFNDYFLNPVKTLFLEDVNLEDVNVI